MASTQKISITLPVEMASQVKARVISGQYDSEDEVIREGLRALADQEYAMEKWIREEAMPAYKALEEDPSRGLTLEQVSKNIDEEFRKLVEKQKACNDIT